MRLANENGETAAIIKVSVISEDDGLSREPGFLPLLNERLKIQKVGKLFSRTKTPG